MLAGESVELYADRALLWPRTRTLYVADVHLGKAAAFRAGGVAVPDGATESDLARLDRLLRATAAERLVVLGDFLHAASGVTATLDRTFRAWRAAHASTEIVVVRGNHDARAGDPPADWHVRIVREPHDAGAFLLCHHPPRDDRATTQDLFGYTLCGHVHPGVRIEGAAREAARLPCFVLGERRAILPAFGRFTGLATVAPAPHERIVVIAGDRLFALPR